MKHSNPIGKITLKFEFAKTYPLAEEAREGYTAWVEQMLNYSTASFQHEEKLKNPTLEIGVNSRKVDYTILEQAAHDAPKQEIHKFSMPFSAISKDLIEIYKLYRQGHAAPTKESEKSRQSLHEEVTSRLKEIAKGHGLEFGSHQGTHMGVKTIVDFWYEQNTHQSLRP